MPHTRLRPTFRVDGQAAQESLFDEAPASLIDEEQVGGRIIPHVEIQVSVIVQVGPEHSQSVESARISSTHRFGDFRKGPVPVVAVEAVTRPGEACGTAQNNRFPVAAHRSRTTYSRGDGSVRTRDATRLKQTDWIPPPSEDRLLLREE